MPLVRKLETLEADRFTLQQEHQRARKDLTAAKLKRPTVAEVHRLFDRSSEWLEAATEEERAELLPLLVGEVAMETKEKGSLEILLNLRSPLREFGFSSPLRDVNRVKNHNPRHADVPIHVYGGGRSRKKVPREWLRVGES